MQFPKAGRIASMLLPLLVLVSMVLSPSLSATATATAAYQTNTNSEINRSLAELSRAERAEDYNLLYDLMVPSARSLIPRAAFVNWWPTVAPPAPADVLKIGELSFADTTYELTDSDFGNVASISYSYHNADGNAEERTVRLAEVGGVWRWMPDIAQDDLPEIRAQSGFTVQFTSAYSTDLYRELDTFWAQIFSDWGMDYRSPKDMIGVREAGTQTGCGTLEDLEEVFAHYCTRDEIIYFNPEMRDVVIDNFGQAAWEMVIAHEWGHHIQNISGMYVTKSPELFGGNYSIEHELQADCLAGIFMQDATARGFFDDRAMQEMDQMIDLGGDAAGTQWDDITAHGTTDQRRQSLLTGYDDGLRGCHLQDQ